MYLDGIKNRIGTILKKIYYKICYGNKIKIGQRTHFRKGFIITIRKNGKIIIGKKCFFNNYCSISSMEKIKIGNNCIFGENVKIYDQNHVFNKSELIINQGYNCNEVIIGDNCWFGSNVIILKNSQIGNNVVIGAGCVINEKIPDNTIVKLIQDKKIEKIRINERENNDG